MWNTKGSNRPPILRDIEYFVYAHVLKNHNFWVFCPNSAILRWPNLTDTVKRRIYTSRPIIWACNPIPVIKISIPYKLIFGKPLILDILAEFGHRPVAETVKRHLYKSRPFIWALYPIYVIICSARVLARSSLYCEKTRCFWTFLPNLVNFRWPNLAETVSRTSS